MQAQGQVVGCLATNGHHHPTRRLQLRDVHDTLVTQFFKVQAVRLVEVRGHRFLNMAQPWHRPGTHLNFPTERLVIRKASIALSPSQKGHGGIRKLASGIRKLEVVFGNWYSGNWKWYSETGQWYSETGQWYSETGQWYSETGQWYSETGKWYSETGIRKLEVVFGNWKVVFGNWESYSETGKRYSETEIGIWKLI